MRGNGCWLRIKNPTLHHELLPTYHLNPFHRRQRSVTHAAWTTTTKRAGLGWILGNTTTSPQVSGSSASSFVSSPLLAEALALREAIRAAHAANLPNVWMRSDSQVLVRAVNSKKFPMELYGVLMDIEYLSSRFMFFLLSFIPREQNSAADSLATSALCIEPATLQA